MGKNFLIAKDALQIAESTDKFYSRVYRQIKSEAEDGYSYTDICMNKVCNTIKENIIQELRANGYIVTDNSFNYIRVSWSKEDNFNQNCIVNHANDARNIAKNSHLFIIEKIKNNIQLRSSMGEYCYIHDVSSLKNEIICNIIKHLKDCDFNVYISLTDSMDIEELLKIKITKANKNEKIYSLIVKW